MKTEDLPAINAVLNGLSTILLLVGFVLIKQRKLKAHGFVMLGATISSALFLVGYVAHKVLLRGVDVRLNERFPNLPEYVKHIYWWVILTPHLILAVVMLPFIYLGLYNAARRRFDKHKQINRFTIWMWLYVSITGVLIYVLLYHLFPDMQQRAAATIGV